MFYRLLFFTALLPTQYQIAPVCETISRALLLKPVEHLSSHAEKHSTHHHEMQAQHELSSQPAEHNHHDASHQCQYCTVYGNLVLPPDLELKAVLDRIQVRFSCISKSLLRMFGLHCNNSSFYASKGEHRHCLYKPRHIFSGLNGL